MPEFIDTKNISTGVVGLGLMGCSITTCLLIAGHPVVAVAPIPDDLKHAKNRITEHLRKSKEEGLVNNSPDYYLARLTITEDYHSLKDCSSLLNAP
jgi:3-hydroxybutyryl-CoA dehydrogenase